MSIVSSNDQNDADREADRHTNTMKEQLRKDVASWSAARSEGSTRQTEEFSMPAARQSAPRPARQTKQSAPATPAIKPAAVAKKPFSMSYDGTTTAEHITHMIARGAR